MKQFAHDFKQAKYYNITVIEANCIKHKQVELIYEIVEKISIELLDVVRRIHSKEQKLVKALEKITDKFTDECRSVDLSYKSCHNYKVPVFFCFNMIPS